MIRNEIFDGVYVPQWEVARFVVIRRRRFFGLLPRVEKWLAHFPGGFLFPPPEAPSGGGSGRNYRMRVRGFVGPSGRFGHMGICERELFVSEVLACSETIEPGPTW
jgi:hypothetical protein